MVYIKNPLQKIEDEINSLETFKKNANDETNDFSVSAYDKMKDNLFKLMKELKAKKQ
jgi:hypothetical protein